MKQLKVQQEKTLGFASYVNVWMKCHFNLNSCHQVAFTVNSFFPNYINQDTKIIAFVASRKVLKIPNSLCNLNFMIFSLEANINIKNARRYLFLIDFTALRNQLL